MSIRFPFRLLCNAGLLFWLASAGATTNDVVVKIGVSGPLSGSQSFSGKDDERGATLAVDEINERGLLVGGQKLKFVLVSQDDQADPRIGVQVAQQLVDQGVKAIVGPYNSGVTIPAGRIYSAAGVPIFTVSSNPVVTRQGYKNLFRIGPNDSQLGGSMARYAVKDLKAKTAVVVDDATAYGQGVAQEFASTAKSLGVDLVGHEYTSDKAIDFSAIATTIKAKSPDVVFYGGTAAQAAPLVNKLRSLGVKAPLLGGDAICTDSMAKLAGPAATGVYCAQGGADLAQLKRGASFAQRFRNHFGEPPQQYAVNFYDGVMMIADAMQRAGSTDVAAFGKVIQDGSYDGVAGVYAFDANGDQKSAIITVYRFSDGKLTMIGQR